jgi:hypothetical protein
VFTEPLPRNERRDTFMKFVVEMGSDAVIYIPSFIKIGSGIQKLIGGIHRHPVKMEVPQAYFRKQI